jgi:phosphoserine phosphatase RsbU/P
MRIRTEDSFDRMVVFGRWLVLFSVLLALLLEHTVGIDRLSVVNIVVLAGLYNAAVQIWLNKHGATQRLRIFFISMDLVFVTIIVHLSGGIGSPFFDIYYLIVIVAALQHGVRGGFIAAAVALVLILGTEELTEVGRERLTDIDRLISVIPYLFLIAITVGYLSRQLGREAERRRVAELQARELEAEQERARIEMELAQGVQEALLPTELPVVPGLEIAAGRVPAREIGGDLYEVISDRSGTLVAAIVDVSGKGIPGALALSGLKSALDRSRSLKLTQLLSDLNRFMLANTPEEMFATMAICAVNPRSGKMRVSSAGHEPVLVIRTDGSVEQIQPEGLPLGVLAEVDFSESRITLEQGDMVVMYTDGVTDSRCNGEHLGLEGLTELAAANRSSGPQAVLEAVFRKLRAEYETLDDATLVVLGLMKS